MPKLRVLAGPSTSELSPIKANTYEGIEISTEKFEGRISVFLKEFHDKDGEFHSGEEYFGHADRKAGSYTWSIQARGHYKNSPKADDVLFGNLFDRKLPLPYGSSAAIAFIQYQDPTLEHDLYNEKQPWALSPLVMTVPFLAAQKAEAKKTDVLRNPIKEDPEDLLGHHPTSKTERKTHFRDQAVRKGFTIEPDLFLETDFAQGFLSFKNGLALTFPIMGGHFDLLRYWDGRPVWFVCCERGKDGKGPGDQYWAVAFEIVDEAPSKETPPAKEEETEPTPENKTQKDISGDVD